MSVILIQIVTMTGRKKKSTINIVAGLIKRRGEE